MKYFLEIWLRGFAKDYLREISENSSERYHPHITFIRPFQTRNEEKVKELIINFCKDKPPIFFTLEGVDSFKPNITYVGVNSKELLNFNDGLEKCLEKAVEFGEKLNNTKKFHATIHPRKEISEKFKIDQYMLRLTAIKDKKIWFSYDFITKETLNREESLDNAKWYNTIHLFTSKYKLLPTRQGYKSIIL